MGQGWKMPPILWGSARTGDRIGELAHELRRAVEQVAREEKKAREGGGGGSGGGGGGGRATSSTSEGAEQQQQQQMGGGMAAVGTGGAETRAAAGLTEEDAAYAEGMRIAQAYSQALQASQAQNTEWIEGVQSVADAAYRTRCYAAGLTVTYRQNYWLAHAINAAMQEQLPKGGAGEPTV